MKRFLLIALMMWNFLFGRAIEPNDWANKAYYAMANSELLSMGPDSSRVVLMGNSITEFWVESHPDFFNQNGLVGRGIGGQVSSQMLARFRQDVIYLSPCIVVINCGTNDIAENNGPYDEDITMDNIISMTELALAHGIKVILSSVLPCDQFCWNPGVKNVVSKINHLNRRIADYAALQDLPYIDYYSKLVTREGALRSDCTDDGVHPNATGYYVMEQALMEMLEKQRH